MNNKNLYCQLICVSTLNQAQSTIVTETIKSRIEHISATEFSICVGGSTYIHIIPRRSHAAIDLDFTSVYIVSESQNKVIELATTVRDLPAQHGRSTLFWSQVFPINAKALNTFSHVGDLLFGDPRASVNIRLDLSLMTVLLNNPRMSISQVRDFDAWLSETNLGFELTRSETNKTHVRKATSRSRRERDSQDREIRYGISLLDHGQSNTHLVDKVGVQFSLKWDRRLGSVDVEDSSQETFSIYDRSGNPQPNVLLRDVVNIASLYSSHLELSKESSTLINTPLFLKDTYFI